MTALTINDIRYTNVAITTRSILLIIFRYTCVTAINRYEIPTIRRYFTPSPITSGSDVKIRIKGPGIVKANVIKITAIASEIVSPIPRIFSIVLISFFPQYCAVSTVAPDVMPKKISIIINWICPASEEPDNTFSPTLPSIITSTAVTPTLIRFWIAIGIIKANTFL